ncbi:MAG: YcxB family protein [Eubacteriales bacterium]|nr:YcxB family protein [Lachnospiraceae bacterium]MDO5126935.1 YcxB family protein [Eubacteriales bacterium]
MTAAKTKSVKMNFSALYSYIINTNYRSLSGVMGIVISVGSLVCALIFWTKFAVSTKIMLILVALLFTVINPLMLAFKAFQQLKLSPSYKKPIDYTFTDDGITISQGDVSTTLTWKQICRLMLTKQMLAIYTSRIHAFVIPVSELGEDGPKILTSVVQFTSQYNPKLSNSLKRYQSGKGM